MNKNMVNVRGNQTDQGILDEVRGLVGVKLREGFDFNEFATSDTIRHFAFGIGDSNPLWLDQDYAKSTKFGTVLAPPTFLFSVDHTGVQPGLDGLGSLFVGCDFEWYDVIRLGDRLRAEASLFSVEEKTSKLGKRMILQTSEVLYKNDRSTGTIGKAHADIMRIQNGNFGYNQREGYAYSKADLAKISEDTLKEERRGDNPRNWEDVIEGDQITPVVKGPLTMHDYMSWLAGRGVYGSALEISKTKPRWEEQHDPGHYSTEEAERLGMPGTFDDGPSPVSWFGHLITNWMGDDGFLSRLQVRLNRPNILGDTTWCKGFVYKQIIDGRSHKVECILEGLNQLG